MNLSVSLLDNIKQPNLTDTLKRIPACGISAESHYYGPLWGTDPQGDVSENNTSLAVVYTGAGNNNNAYTHQYT